MMRLDRRHFFDSVRRRFGRLNQPQVDGYERLLTGLEADDLRLTQAAYLLATVYHETARTMAPITEYGGRRYFDKYDTGRLAKALGNTPEKDGDGWLYRGRGYCQLTGHANYARFGELLDLPLVNDPDLALDPDIAYRILSLGMQDGLFTGAALSDYLNAGQTDYIQARRIVNGTDRAEQIARYATSYEAALRRATIHS